MCIRDSRTSERSTPPCSSRGAWKLRLGQVHRLDGKIIAMESFGASAPAGLLFKKFGFTVEHVVEVAKSLK